MTEKTAASLARRNPRLARRLRRAGWALAVERLWRRLWLAPYLLAGYIGLSLMEVPQSLPGYGHLTVFGLCLVAVLWISFRALWDFDKPDPAERRHFLEARSPALHRPLSALSDEMAIGQGDPVSERLWRAHLEQAAKEAEALRAGLPHPNVGENDPYVLRAACLLALFIGLFAGHGQEASRLLAGVSPSLSPFAPPVTLAKVWMTPPAYTGRAPILLDGLAQVQAAQSGVVMSAPPPLYLPQGSEIKALVHGGPGQPSLQLGGEEDVALERLEAYSHQGKSLLQESGALALVQDGETLASWTVEVESDSPPEATFIGAVTETPRQSLRLPYDAKDDYGLTSLTLSISLTGQPDLAPELRSVILAGTEPVAAQGISIQDLTAHPWAGLDVDLRLIATDHPGQVGRSAPLSMTLPERAFAHPGAKAIVAERKGLIAKPERLGESISALERISKDVALIDGDRVVFLALKRTVQRLERHPEDAMVPWALDMLWRSALRLEEGELATAERRLSRAEEALSDALAEGADFETINRLINDLKSAFNEYRRALAERLAAQGFDPEEALTMPDDAEALDLGATESLMERLRQMAGAGAREAAQQMMADLRQQLDALRNAALAPPDQGPMQEAKEMLEALDELVRRQHSLLRRSFERNQDRTDPNRQRPEHHTERSADTFDDKMSQEALAQELNALTDRIRSMTQGDGAAPDLSRLQAAEDAMGQAAQALGREDLDGAGASQGEAAEHLRQGMEQAMDAIAQSLSRQGGVTIGRIGGDPSGRDPLNRPSGIEDRVYVPDEGEIRQVDEILRELQRRASDPAREREERDYLYRLLKRF